MFTIETLQDMTAQLSAVDRIRRESEDLQTLDPYADSRLKKCLFRSIQAAKLTVPGFGRQPPHTYHPILPVD